MGTLKVVCSILLAGTIVCAQEQAPTGGRPAGGRVMTATRAVTKYTGLERALLSAVQAKDDSKSAQLLSDDFEVWSAEKMAPTPRSEWTQEWAGVDTGSFEMRNMAVREFGDVSVVSFLLERSGTANGRPLGTAFIVDVWRGEKLSVRYESEPAKPARSGGRPTGKE